MADDRVMPGMLHPKPACVKRRRAWSSGDSRLTLQAFGERSMPAHAQIVCIGRNCLFAFFFMIAAGMGFSSGDFGMALFMTAMAGAALYSAWVLLKFRKYL